MDPSSSSQYYLAILFFFIVKGASGATFTVVNNCGFTVWPANSGNAGSPALNNTGFELPTGSSRSIQAPRGWVGRFWGRTGCIFNESGHGSCASGDCGSGELECNGTQATPPATLVEFALNQAVGMDFYDVSIVDGFNLQVTVEPTGGSGSALRSCATTGCVDDLNRRCPRELRSEGGCRSACEAFGSPEYCCTSSFGSPSTCRPTAYCHAPRESSPRSRPADATQALIEQGCVNYKKRENE